MEFLEEAKRKATKRRNEKRKKQATTLTGAPINQIVSFPQVGGSQFTSNGRAIGAQNGATIMLKNEETNVIQISEYIDMQRIPIAADRATGAPLDGVEVGTDSMAPKKILSPAEAVVAHIGDVNQRRRRRANKLYDFYVNSCLGDGD